MKLIKKFLKFNRDKGFKFAVISVMIYFLLCVKRYKENKIIRKYKKENDEIKLDVYENKMLLNFKGKGIHRDLILYKEREPKCVKIIKKLIEENSIFYDIGANIGMYSLIASKKAKKVYAIEPYEENIKYLKKNIELNNKKNIHIKKLAFSSEKGKKEFYISEKCNWCSMNKVPYIKEKIEINTDTLDNFSKKNKPPNFLRMDLEGYEYEVLYEGGKETIKKYKPKIFLEFHSGAMGKNKAIKLLKFLKNENYEILHILNDKNDYLLGRCMLSKIIKFLSDVRKNLNVQNIDELIDSIKERKYFPACEIFLSAED